MSAAPEQAPARAGRLVLVAGPSGSGKDTLIRAVREKLAGHPRFVFPRRVITRPASEAEDNEPCDPDRFARIAADGGFAIAWQAHGLSYGIPAAIEADLAAGRTVICNVSRTVVAELRTRYGEVVLVEVTAPPDVLAARLAGRGRSQDGDLGRRLARSREVGAVRADVTIVNAGTVDEAVEALAAALEA